MIETISSNDIRVYPCRTWQEFNDEVRKTRFKPKHNKEDETYNFGTGVIYRGHSQTCYRLSSTIERNCLYLGEVTRNGEPVKDPNLRSFNGLEWYDTYCNHILERFRILSRGIGRIDENLTDPELWAVGRHYGLLSPYLDWTVSPFVAAFFAFEEIYNEFQYMKSSYQMRPTGGIVQVWGLRLWDDLQEDEVFEVSQIYGHHSTRPRAQQAWFTKLRSKDHIDIQPYLQDRGKENYLERYDLDIDMAMTALRDLDLMNINYLTLFPDAVGLARHANIDTDNFRLALAIQDMKADQETEEAG